MILLVCILYTLEGEHEDIPGHSIRGLEDFSLIASCLLAFKQFQIVCVSVVTCLALATRGSFLPFCVGIFALGLPLGEGTRSPVYDSHLWRVTHIHPFHQHLADQLPHSVNLEGTQPDRQDRRDPTWDG